MLYAHLMVMSCYIYVIYIVFVYELLNYKMHL